MSKKNKNRRSGIMYSTNPDFEYNDNNSDEVSDIAPGDQILRIYLDRKQRAGKEVTLITGFEGSDDSLKELGKLLKSKCGVGGSVKDGEIILQGNHRDKVLNILIEKGYNNTKKSGG